MKSIFRDRNAFTLFEMMLSIAILSVFVGGVFQSIQSSLKVVESLYFEQEIQTTASSLTELLRKNFATLPRETIFTLSVQPKGKQYFSEIILQNAPLAFTWGKDSAYYGLIELGIKPTENGLLA
ncbi:MAG: type II secretion system protein, partial [Chthoniobacterales bacterium]